MSLQAIHSRAGTFFLIAGVSLLLSGSPSSAQDTKPRVIRRTIVADVVALDYVYYYNRLGAHAPDGMIYALKRDVVSTIKGDASLNPGKVTLREGKRPRPLVLRMNVGDVLEVHFTNLLLATPPPPPPPTPPNGPMAA